MYVSMYVYVCMYVYVYVCMCMYVYTSMYVCEHTYIRTLGERKVIRFIERRGKENGRSGPFKFTAGIPFENIRNQ